MKVSTFSSLAGGEEFYRGPCLLNQPCVTARTRNLLKTKQHLCSEIGDTFERTTMQCAHDERKKSFLSAIVFARAVRDGKKPLDGCEEVHREIGSSLL